MKCPECKEVKLVGKYKEIGMCASCCKKLEEKITSDPNELKIEFRIPPEPYTRRQVGPAIVRREEFGEGTQG